MSIRWKLLFAVASPVLLVYLLVSVREYSLLKADAIADKRDLAEAQATYFASRFDGAIREMAQIASSTASFLTLHPDQSEEDLFALIDVAIGQSPFVYGACIAFEPGSFDPSRELFAPYGHRDSGSLRHLDIGTDAYDYRGWEWYAASRDANEAVWTEPYFDEGAGNVLMCTYSAPFYGDDGAFRGVATVDIQLVPLQLAVNVTEQTGGNFVIVSRGGRFISHPDPSMIMSTLTERAAAAGQPELVDVQARIGRGESGFRRMSNFPTDQPNWIYFTPVENSGWSFAVVTPERVVLEPVYAGLQRLTLSLTGGLLVMLAAITLVSYRVTRPIRRLTEGVRSLATGDLATHVTGAGARDEFGELARGFNSMVEQLDQHIDALSRESAAREQAEGQLRIASEVQRSLLPREQLTIKGYDLAGWNEPADETGGDYFDWQPLADGRWAISIADVTGHGIGPALVTAFCRAYSRATLRTTSDLGRCLQDVNGLICPDLSPGKFVTFAVAIISPTDSALTLLSAGHGPSLLYRAASGEVEQFIADGVPLGVLQDAEYGPPHRLDLSPGDVLVMLTDGFFEWKNKAGEQFGTDRLVSALGSCASEPCERIIRAIHSSVLAFADGSPQDDDLTIVVLKRAPNDA